MHRMILGWLIFASLNLGCRTEYREDLDYSYNVEQTWTLEDLAFGQIVQFESVPWEPAETVSLRNQIVENSIASGRDILEIGTGTGLIAVLCLQNDAKSVVAIDKNPAAVACAKYNAAALSPTSSMDVRLDSPDSSDAFSVIASDETFDLIVFHSPTSVPLISSLLDGLPSHLNPAGKCLLTCSNTPMIRRLIEEAKERRFVIKVLDDRRRDRLGENFLPGMLIELKPPLAKPSTSKPADAEMIQPDGSVEKVDVI